MNTGVICNRYARALILLTDESGRAEQVYAQASAMLSGQIPQKMEPDLEKFISLVIRNGRADYLKQMLWNFCQQYRTRHRICKVSLTTATESPALKEQLLAMASRRENVNDVNIVTKVNPDLIGGFVLEMDGYILDASVKRQLDLIRHDLDEMNKRLV